MSSVPGSSPSLQAQHPSAYLLALAAHLLAPPRSHPSTGWNIVYLARGCSPGQHSKHPLDTPGKNEELAIYPVPLLFAPSPKQLAVAYPRAGSYPLEEVFGRSCQGRRTSAARSWDLILLPRPARAARRGGGFCVYEIAGKMLLHLCA